MHKPGDDVCWQMHECTVVGKFVASFQDLDGRWLAVMRGPQSCLFMSNLSGVKRLDQRVAVEGAVTIIERTITSVDKV